MSPHLVTLFYALAGAVVFAMAMVTAPRRVHTWVMLPLCVLVVVGYACLDHGGHLHTLIAPEWHHSARILAGAGYITAICLAAQAYLARLNPQED